jgi:hypothetical protein
MSLDFDKQFEAVRRDCQIGMKAYQNLDSSVRALERLKDTLSSHGADPTICSALFHLAIIRYAKPFVGMKISTGTVQYPIRQLKATEGFSVQLHHHLLKVRNTLIAHDDFQEIEPRLLSFNIKHAGGTIDLPLEITISNKCVEWAREDDVEQMRSHLQAAVDAVLAKLVEDAGRFRRFVIDHPDDAEKASKYSRSLGRVEIPIAGKRIGIPDLTGDAYLNVPEPDFAAHYEYARVDVRVRFRDELEIVAVDRTRLRVSYPDDE